jgi:hypothetical protein
LSPSSSTAHSTFFTLTELTRPQIFSIETPKSGTDHDFHCRGASEAGTC